MSGDLLTIMLSSGFVSGLVTFLIILLYVGKYREKVDRHDKDNERLNQQILDISKNLSKLEGLIENNKNSNIYIARKSPLNLTDKGKALLIDSSGKDYIDLRINEFLKEIKKKSPKTAYDVQELSIQLVEKRTKSDEFNNIKEFSFRQGLSLDTLTQVLGIYLRDILLKKLGPPIRAETGTTPIGQLRERSLLVGPESTERTPKSLCH